MAPALSLKGPTEIARAAVSARWGMGIPAELNARSVPPPQHTVAGSANSDPHRRIKLPDADYPPGIMTSPTCTNHAVLPASARYNVSARGDMGVGSPELRPLETSPDITQLLIAWGGGDLRAMERLAPVLQQALHRVASAHLAVERRGHILQTTALVNETYLRLIDWTNVRWQNRAQFFALASQMMRHILVDYARVQHREKRGGSAVNVSLSQAEGVPLNLGRSGGARPSLADTRIVRAASGPHGCSSDL